MNCKNSIPKDQLPKLISKLEYFIFEAIRREGLDFFKLVETGFKRDISRILASLYNREKNTGLILEKIAEYKQQAIDYKEAGEDDVAEWYTDFATNLTNMLVVWDELLANFFVFSSFKFKTRLELNEEGTVDMSKLEQDTEVYNTKGLIDFDVQANEIDLVDDIDKSVEMFLRSIKKLSKTGGVITEEYDEYGYSLNVDYISFVRGLAADLENSNTISEMVEILKSKLDETPEYRDIIDKLEYKGPNKNNTRLAIAFKNSFSKALVPIYSTMVDNEVVKVYESTIAKKSLIEKKAISNFIQFGLEVEFEDETIQLAHVNEEDTWSLDKSSIDKFESFFKSVPNTKIKEAQISFLKGLGFEFSDATIEELMSTNILGPRVKVGNQPRFWYLYDRLVKGLENDPTTRPLDVIKRDNYKTSPGKRTVSDFGQIKLINDIIEIEAKNNRNYNIERSVLNAEGSRQHAQQSHTTFTVLNKYYSDYNLYPDLQSIISQPEMFWLDPESNPMIKSSLFLNSLFFLDPSDPITYGKRKRIYTEESGKKVFSHEKGDYNKIHVVNNNGLVVMNDFESVSSSTTSLTKVDKIIQDINSFIYKGFKSTLRLGDKSTDLGIYMDYYEDSVTKQPVSRPVFSQVYVDIFATPQFLNYIKGVLIDTITSKYLNTKGYLKEFKFSDKNLKTTWGFFEDNSLLSEEIKSQILNHLDSEDFTIDQIPFIVEQYSDDIESQVTDYYNNYHKQFMELLAPLQESVPSNKLIGRSNLSENVKYYLANAVALDIEQMKMFFGDTYFFKDPHKRFSKDSASGKFTTLDKNLIDELNDHSDNQSYGFNSSLFSRMLADRLHKQNKITQEQKDMIVSRSTVSESFKSAVIKEVEFSSKQKDRIPENISMLKDKSFLTPEQEYLYDNYLHDVIVNSYSELQKEADGQGKCTFDFYRLMSIITNEWSTKQEDAYRKIVMYYHYSKLLEDNSLDENEKAEILNKRNNVGYESLEGVYFPPKKFQYSGPLQYSKNIDGKDYNAYIPIFDKFSLQPLIPTVVMGTNDEELLNRMSFEGIGYVKFESGTKTEVNKDTDSIYDNLDPNNIDDKLVTSFEERLNSQSTRFNSEQTLFHNFLKEQVRIDPGIHDHTVLGTQMRKLSLMNILQFVEGKLSGRPEFLEIYNDYKNSIKNMVEIEKNALYNEFGVKKASDNTLSIRDMKKLIDFFIKEIDKKDQDSNVRKSISYNEEDGSFDIPLDASTQAQVIEGIIISAFNSRVVRYKTNGSMLTQVATTGNEAKRFSSSKSQEATSIFGNSNLKYYDVDSSGKDVRITQMEVKIGLTGQWKKLLNLKHFDGNTINTRERLNEALLDENWRNSNQESISLIAYRIPTQGRNFLDSMIIKEFLPEEFGDAIIMPSEVVIKSGSDFDIDKMFVFYPNLTTEGLPVSGKISNEDIKKGSQRAKAISQNNLYKAMRDLILHPSNYLELVTPSTNFLIEPIVEKIYQKLGFIKTGQSRPKTDYKNTDLINEILNMSKFESLLKGKKDLGIAAIANTFNVLFQLSGAKSSREFLISRNLKSFFTSNTITKVEPTVDPEGKYYNLSSALGLTELDYSSIYDESGMLKSEFFAEFINAFVDVAKDDYVFAINAVTELTPLIFYMKYMGLSSKKILYFINQPIIRAYIKNLSKFENAFVKAEFEKNKEIYKIIDNEIFNLTQGEPISKEEKAILTAKLLEKYGLKNKEDDKSIRRKALRATLKDFGFEFKGGFALQNLDIEATFDRAINNDYDKLLDVTEQFSESALYNNIGKPNTINQLAYILEFINLKIQSDSLTEIQGALNFDTNTYTSSFDIYIRKALYEKGIENRTILSRETIQNIAKSSVIAPIDVQDDLRSLLSAIMPIRNGLNVNQILFDNLSKVFIQKEDLLKAGRVAKNDLSLFILQNFLGQSVDGMDYFHVYFDTNKDLNQYLIDLITTNKISDKIKEIKSLDYYQDIVDKYPIISNLIVEVGEKNPRLKSYVFLQLGNNKLDKESAIRQYQDIVQSESEEMEPVRQLFKDLALYSAFQSGLNTSDISYTSIVPLETVSRLTGYAMKEFSKLPDNRKAAYINTFLSIFYRNNPSLTGSSDNRNMYTGDISKRGKWYYDLKRPNFKDNPKTLPNKDSKALDYPINKSTDVKQNIIPLQSDFTRESIKNDSDYLYLFTDNAERASGPNNVDLNSWYAKKYQTGKRLLTYPSKTQAVARGLNNGYPITTMVNDKGTQWKDEQFEEYKKIIDDEIETIKQAIPNYKGIKFGGQMQFGKGQISDMKNSAPKIWNYLNIKLAEIGIDNTGDKPIAIKTTSTDTNTISPKGLPDIDPTC